MPRKKTDPAQSAPVVPQVSSGKQEQETRWPKFVVVRDGHRVSAHEYDSPTDQKALAELEFWRKVEKKESWGAKVEIVQYDNKVHRIWGELTQ